MPKVKIPTPAPVLGGLLIAALTAGCAGMLAPPSAIPPAKADTIIKSNFANPNLVVIDVRSREEFVKSHLKDALNLTLESVSFRTEIDALDRDKTYILYCRSGNRSLKARKIMKEMEFDNVVTMIGGILAWQRAGLRTVRESWE